MIGDEIVWTGDNVGDIVEFAQGGHFGFAVGSTFHRERWWHRRYNRATRWLTDRLEREWLPKEDPTVLEIYPDDSPGVGDPWHWTTARPGDVIDRHGRVRRGS